MKPELLTPERWQEIERLYHAALEREASSRVVFLAKACSTDPVLRREVESLLSFDTPAEDFIETPALEVAALWEPEPQARSMVGQKLGSYELLSLLGAGGMGEVYRARDPRLDREVAIKVLTEHLGDSREALARFQREAKAVAALSHPNIFAIHDFGTDQDVCFAVMELLEGETLRSRLERGALPWREAVEIAVGIADGLSAAHAKEIIHLDLKPENVFLTRDFQVKILDFGIARMRPASSQEISSESTATANTNPGMLLGTPGYMSPEQLRGERVQATTDIFSLGCVLYEMLTGQRAFDRPTAHDVVAAVLRDPPPALAGTGTEFPPALEQTILRCLEKQPQHRYQSARDLALDLRATLLALNGFSSELKSGQAVEQRSAASARKRRWLAAAVLLGAVLLCIGGFWLLGWRRLLPGSRSPSTLTAVPLTSYPGQELQPSFSPEGNHVAFSWNGEKQGNFDIYVKQIGHDKPVRLTTDPARDFSPAWSPDGRTIAFGRQLDLKRSGVFLIPALRGPERMLAESTSPAVYRPRPFVAWSPDGKWLAYSDVDEMGANLAPTGAIPVSLFLISIETGERRRLTSRPPDSVGDSGPAFAPDGHALAFVRTPTLAISNLYLLPLSRGLIPTGEPRRLTSGSVFTSSPSWSPNGRDIIVASGQWGRLQLWRVAEAGTSPPQRLEFLAGRTDDATVSRRGQLAYSQKSTDINVWRTAISGPGVNAGRPARFIASTMIDANPQFSPDGKRIVFPSDRSGTREIWVCDQDGSNTTKLTSMGAPISGSPRWSPDGSRIVFDSNLEGQFELYVIAASGGPVKRLTNNPADESYGRWSLDSRWIYFMSSRSAQRQVWKMLATGGEAVQVTKNGGVVPYPSPDSDFLYYSERAGQGESNGSGGLRRLRLVDGQDEQILPSVTFLNVAVTRDGIYFIPRADAEGRHSVHFFSFRMNKTSPIVRLTGRVSEGLAVSPDGRSLLYTQVDEERSDLMLVEGFR